MPETHLQFNRLIDKYTMSAESVPSELFKLGREKGWIVPFTDENFIESWTLLPVIEDVNIIMEASV